MSLVKFLILLIEKQSQENARVYRRRMSDVIC